MRDCTQDLETLAHSGWPLGIGGAVLILPPAWQLLPSVVAWLSVCSTFVIAHARYSMAAARKGAALVTASPRE